MTGADTRLTYDDADEPVSQLNAGGIQIASFDYNANGERTARHDLGSSDLQRTYSWDAAGRLRSFHSTLQPALPGTPVEQLASYNYDADGLLASLEWSHAESGLAEPVADGTFLYVNGPDGLPLEQVSAAGTVRYYHHDALGSTRALTTAAGVVAGTYDYDPYGRLLTNSTLTNPFGFAGQYTDARSGLVYMRARWYDPETGQFMSRDPLGFAGGDQNLYGYAGRDPVNHVDPSGMLDPCSWPVVSAACSAASGVVDAFNPFNSNNVFHSAVSGVAAQIGFDWDSVVRDIGNAASEGANAVLDAAAHSAPLVDLAAIAVCLGSDGALCGVALDAAYSVSTAAVGHDAVETQFSDPLHLAAEQTINGLFYGSGRFLKWAGSKFEKDLIAQVALKAPTAYLQGFLDFVEWRMQC